MCQRDDRVDGWSMLHRTCAECVMMVAIGSKFKTCSQKPNHPGSAGSLKAAECGRMIPFCLHLLCKFGGSTRFGVSLIQAGVALERYMDLMRENPLIVPPDKHRFMLEALELHLRACAATGIKYSPKFHVVVHMTIRTLACFFVFLCCWPLDVFQTQAPSHSDVGAQLIGPPVTAVQAAMMVQGSKDT